MSLRAVVPGLAIVAVLVAACRGGGYGTREFSLRCPSRGAFEAPEDLSALSLEEVYQRMAGSMTCPGYVLKVVTTQQYQIVYPQEATASFTTEGTMWIDVAAERAREETRTEYSVPWEQGEISAVRVLLGDEVYAAASGQEPARGSEALVCHGSQSAVISLLLGCGADIEDEDSESRFEPQSEYQGQPMPALVTEGSVSAEIGTTIFTQYLYLDDQTFLPVSNIVEGTQNKGNPAESPVEGESTNDYEFISLDSLPKDFFDPAAIGYVEPDLEEELRGADVGMAVYWLGVEFAGRGSLPALKLRDVYVPDPEPDGPRYPVSIDYSLADKKFGSPVVGLSLYPRSAWDTARPGGGIWDDPCAQETEVDLGDRHATVVGGYGFRSSEGGCPEQPPDWWGANVYVEGTVIHVHTSNRGKFLHEYAPPGSQNTSREWVQNPYSSREGMEAIIRGLVPRPPD